MDVVRYCTCRSNLIGSEPCFSCYGPASSTPVTSVRSLSPEMDNEGFEGRGIRVYHHIPSLIFSALSGALTCLFALAGAFTGAVTGALAGKASNIGVLRGAGLGAIAGAVLSIEILEASRAYWLSERSISQRSSMADFMEELLRGRFVEEPFRPSMFGWQVRIAHISYDEIHDVFGEVASRGLSGESLKKLPCHLILDDIKPSQSICCTICLQDIEVGEVARSLPRCHHTFHLKCVDKWLIKQGSCPVCRQDV